jgi:DNA repair protein RecN (Recombination protein N)
MLRRLSIRNYALIDHIEWHCDEGWTVLTGETGSGKSILLGALGLILGDRAEGMASLQSEKCIVEAEFLPSAAAQMVLGALHEADSCIVRRSIAPGGRSRAYVNDEPVKLQFLKALAPLLVDLHGQQDGQRLHASDGLLHAIDGFSTEAQALAQQWREHHASWATAQGALNALTHQDGLPDADADYLRFQLEELDAIDFADPALRNLDARLDSLAHAQDIRQALESSAAALQGEGEDLISRLRSVEQMLEKITAVHGEAAHLLERIRSCRIELDDAAQDAAQQAESIDLDPAALSKAEADKDKINRLLDKHRVADLDGLIERLESMRTQLQDAQNRDQRIAELNSAVLAARQTLDHTGNLLHDCRKKAGEALSSAIETHLQHLKLAEAKIGFEWTASSTPEAAGPYRVSMSFAANPGQPLQPLTKVASGGERSRVMLSLKAALTAHLEVPTLILDEIDAGVSGDVAARMADLIASISKAAQVITISHLPQVAGKADHHFRVFKETRDGRAHTALVPLDKEARIEELAAMLSGETIGDAARAQARSLMA